MLQNIRGILTSCTARATKATPGNEFLIDWQRIYGAALHRSDMAMRMIVTKVSWNGGEDDSYEDTEIIQL